MLQSFIKKNYAANRTGEMKVLSSNLLTKLTQYVTSEYKRMKYIETN
jgi:hypothetical protein